ncbi:hypothetical protein [Lysobacter gummosus]|uniref:hypothetical protein n=1 Tax=Lysobacter gummosus TaxID=262324 RepID=UPI0036298EC8
MQLTRRDRMSSGGGCPENRSVCGSPRHAVDTRLRRWCHRETSGRPIRPWSSFAGQATPAATDAVSAAKRRACRPTR